MSKPPLENDVVHQLQDAPAFNSGLGRNGWHLRNRLVRGLSTTNLQLSGASIQEVDFANCQLSTCSFTNVSFVNVNFQDTDLASVTFERCEFRHCNWSGGQGSGSRFNLCNLQDCSFLRWQMAKGAFGGGTFTNGKILESDWQEVSLIRVGFSRCKLENVDLSFGTCVGCVFENSDWNGVRSLKGRFGPATFSGGMLTNLALSLIEGQSITLNNMEVESADIRAENIVDLVVTNCNLIGALGIGPGKVQNLKIAACHGDGKLVLDRLSGGAINVFDGSFRSLSFLFSTLEGPMKVANSKLELVSAQGSTLRGLIFENVSFGKVVFLKDVRFSGLKLLSPRYAPGLEVRKSGEVTYESSDEFP